MTTAKKSQILLLDPTTELVIIGLDTPDTAEHLLYDERIKLPVDGALVKNISVYGVIEPVIVRKDGDHYLVIDGRQRVRASREANTLAEKEGAEPLRVPCYVRRDAEELLTGVMISANEIRRDDALLIKIEKLGRYLARGRTEADAAVAFGVSAQTIKNWLAVLEAGPAIHKALEQNKITATAAARLAVLPAAEQEAALNEAIEAGGTTAAATRSAAKTRAAKAGEEPPYDPPGKRLLRKLFELEEHQDELDAHTKAVIGWVLGRASPARIKGLTAACRAVGEIVGE